MKLTNEQKEIVTTSLAPGECLKVLAYAGTGKTTALEYYANAHPEPTLYLAFNKSVQQHAERRFSPNVKPSTIHALAYAQWKRNTGGHGQVAGSISPWVICKAFKLTPHWAFVIVKTLDNWFNSADPELTTAHVPIDQKNPIPEAQKPVLVGLAERVWNKMLDQKEWFSMTHSGYLKAYQLEQPLLDYDTIMLDEAQDTNPVTFDIILNQLDHGTRLIMVGDPYQQIYSWRQAIDAMTRVEAQTLYLTRSFRFGKNIAQAASTVLKTFFGETRPVLGLDKADAIVPRLEADKLTYVCRTNATIFEQGAFAAQQGKKIALAAGRFEQFLEEIMDIYYLYAGQVSKIRDKRIARFRDFKTLLEFASLIDPELESKAQIVMKHGNRVPTMVRDIQNASVAIVEEADVLLTTCHRAKGMEWENVVVADDFADLFDNTGMPLTVGTAANPPMEDGKPIRFLEKDEVNLIYVAMTGSLCNLSIRSPDLNRLLNGKWHHEARFTGTKTGTNSISSGSEEHWMDLLD